MTCNLCVIYLIIPVSFLLFFLFSISNFDTFSGLTRFYNLFQLGLYISFDDLSNLRVPYIYNYLLLLFVNHIDTWQWRHLIELFVFGGVSLSPLIWLRTPYCRQGKHITTIVLYIQGGFLLMFFSSKFSLILY